MRAARHALELFANDVVFEEKRGLLLAAQREVIVVGAAADFLSDVWPELEAALRRKVRVRVVHDEQAQRSPARTLLRKVQLAGVEVIQRETLCATVIATETDAMLFGASSLRPTAPTLAVRVARGHGAIEAFLRDCLNVT